MSRFASKQKLLASAAACALLADGKGTVTAEAPLESVIFKSELIHHRSTPLVAQGQSRAPLNVSRQKPTLAPTMPVPSLRWTYAPGVPPLFARSL